MDKHELAALLCELDETVSSSFDVVLIGGAAMILHFGAERATLDVDLIVLRGNARELRTAAKAIAEKRNLPEGWLNDAAKGFADLLPPDFHHRLAPLETGGKHVRFYALGKPEQATLKIIALREQDLEDLEILLPQFTDEDRAVLLQIMERAAAFRPDWAQRIRYFLEEQGWRIE